MDRTEKIKQFCLSFATFGALGEWRLGGVVASLFAIPTMLFFRSVYWLSNIFFYWFVLFLAALVVVVVQAALLLDFEKAQRAAVLDKIVGVMISFIGVSLKWRVIIFGFILFHFLNTMQPFAYYRKIVRYIEKLPGIFGIFGAEILSGFLVNLSLHLIAWVMR